MRRFSSIIITLILFNVAATASNADSALVEHTSWQQVSSLEAMRNPALHGFGYRTAFSQLSLGIDIQRQSQAFIPEKGTGYTLPYLKVNTYHHLNDKSTVWGEASYTTGRQHNITWNSTSDYDLMQPYILADTLGGDTRRERYAISGGYALKINRWAIGAEMRVRAEQEYRNHDPRMRGVVTDLNLRFGTSYSMERYRLGAAIEGNIYRQSNSVAFYREEGVIPEYQMTGLGSVYSRFSGDKRSIYFDGGGVTALIHVSSLDRNGFYADITLDQHRYHRKLSEYNFMPLTDLYNEQAAATVGWERNGRSRIAVFGHFDYTRRTGNEHVGGASDARYFPVIACLTMYKSNAINAHAGLLFGLRNLNVVLNAGYLSQTEKYVYPHRQMDHANVYACLKGQYFFRLSKKLQLTVDARAAYQANVSDKLVMPFANIDAKTTQLIRHKYDYAKANYTDLSARARADYAWKATRFGLFAEVGGGLTLCSTSEHQTAFNASIGITF